MRFWDQGQERKRLKAQYGALYGDAAALLFRHDPMGINFGKHTDEYEPEVSTILPRLAACKSVTEVHQIVYEEFCRWFDVEIAGPFEAYELVSRDLWEPWRTRATRGRDA